MFKRLDIEDHRCSTNQAIILPTSYESLKGVMFEYARYTETCQRRLKSYHRRKGYYNEFRKVVKEKFYNLVGTKEG